jgi:myosin heavy subunit
MAADAKACATKSLPESGLDIDDFRCGKTKIMFRAGRLSKLEEIREGALSKIILKMQCTARVVLMKLSTYNALKTQKTLTSALQRNIRNYYQVRDWPWYKFYTMVKGEMGKILAKMAEDARKKAMAEGLAKIQDKVDNAVAEREAVEAINGELGAKKASLAAVMEGMGSVALADLEAINAADDAAKSAQGKLNQLTTRVANEKAALKKEFEETKSSLTGIKEETSAALSAMKAKNEGLLADAGACKAKAIGVESAKALSKSEILVIMDDVAKLDKAGTGLLRDKKEMLAAIESNQRNVWVHGRLVTSLES